MFSASKEEMTVNDDAGRPRVSLKPTGSLSMTDDAGSERVSVTPPKSEGWCSTTNVLAAVADSSAKVTDLNNDGVTDAKDLRRLKERWGKKGTSAEVDGTSRTADIDGDGEVTRCDELYVRREMGKAVGRRLSSSAEKVPASGEWCGSDALNTILGSDGATKVGGGSFGSADVTGDGKIDIDDRDELLGAMGKPTPSGAPDAKYDVDGDGLVTRCDEIVFKLRWGMSGADYDEVEEDDSTEETEVTSTASPTIGVFDKKSKPRVEVGRDKLEVKNNRGKPKVKLSHKKMEVLDEEGWDGCSGARALSLSA